MISFYCLVVYHSSPRFQMIRQTSHANTQTQKLRLLVPTQAARRHTTTHQVSLDRERENFKRMT